MAISLESLQTSTNELAPMLLIYGTAGMGKTSLALEAPDPVYLQIAPERPPLGIRTTGFGEIRAWDQFMQALQALNSDKNNFKTLIIDSLDALEPMIWKDLTDSNHWDSIETPGYGKGYILADQHWQELITWCDFLRQSKGMTIIWLALATAKDHEEPGTAPYKRYDLKLHKRAEGLMTQAADGVFFINTKVTLKEADAGFGKKTTHAEGGGARWLFTDARPAFVAKHRFLGMPDTILLPKGKAWPEIAKYISTTQA